MENAKDNKIVNAYNYLKEYKGCQVVATVKSVSQSGMSRQIKIAFIKDNSFINQTYNIATLLNIRLSKDRDAMIVTGCGMDMIFDTLANFNYKMADLDQYIKGESERVYDTYFINANDYTLF